MGRFSNYVDSLKSQTNSLRTALTTKSGEDCSNYSIGTCAEAVSRLDTTTDVSNPEYYESPSWYPNIETILTSAQNITKDGTTYYPAYIELLGNELPTNNFYKTTSTSASAINYYNNTGGEAYIFSDVVNNDITNDYLSQLSFSWPDISFDYIKKSLQIILEDK